MFVMLIMLVLCDKVLYLIENPHEYGLSRLCLISYEEFFHTLEVIKEKTDAVGLCSPDFVSSVEGTVGSVVVFQYRI